MYLEDGRKGRLLGAVFGNPFHRTQPAALTFFRPQAPRVQGFFEPPRADRGSRFQHSPSPPRATCFGSSTSVPKWTSLDLLCRSWLVVYKKGADAIQTEKDPLRGLNH